MATQNIAELARELGRSITELRTSLRQHIQVKIRENDIDISFELLEVLAYLFRKDGVNQQEIADIMFKDKSSMTYLLDNLVKRNMVKRTEDENDRRNKLIYLTEKGKSLQDVFDPWITETYEKAAKGIKSADIEKAMSLIQNMNNNLKR